MVERNPRSVHRAPDYEIQSAAVPEPGDDERGEQVEDRPRQAAAASSEREVDVAHDEVAERHVPSFPEILHADCSVRHVEVLGELESEDERCGRDEVYEAAEVAEELDGVGVDGGEERQRRVALRA